MSHTIPPPIDSSGLFWWLKSPHLPALAATIGCLPLLFVHFQQMWVRPHCQYFPLVLAAVAILYHLRRTDPDQEPVQPRPWLAGVALIVGLALSAYAVLRISPLLCYAGWLVSMMAFAFRSQFDAWSSWALLCLIVRLPQGRDVWLIQWLQEITTRVSSGVLDQLRIDHLREGNVLVFPDRKLFVEEACSGVVSLFTIVATAAIFGAFLRRSWFHSILLMLAGAFWAGAANILRVVAIAVSIEKMGIDLTSGWPHDLLGLAVFVVTLVILYSTDGLFRFMFGPVVTEDSSDPEPIHDNALVRLWNCLFWPNHERPKGLLSDGKLLSPRSVGASWILLVLVISGAYLGLGTLQIWGGIGPFSVELGIGQGIDRLAKESLPQQIAGWKLIDFRRETRRASSEFGEQSRQWTYQKANRMAIVSVDYPFPDWHQLTACYQGVGWTMSPASHAADGTTALQYTLNNGVQSGLLIYDMIDQNGEPHQRMAGQRIHPRWARLLSGESSRWTLPTFYQVQTLSVAPTLEPVDSETAADLQRLFIEFRQTIRQTISDSKPGEQL